MKKQKPCPKCKGWGIPQIHTYEVLPCPKCGLGKPANHS